MFLDSEMDHINLYKAEKKFRGDFWLQRRQTPIFFNIAGGPKSANVGDTFSLYLYVVGIVPKGCRYYHRHVLLGLVVVHRVPGHLPASTSKWPLLRHILSHDFSKFLAGLIFYIDWLVVHFMEGLMDGFIDIKIA